MHHFTTFSKKINVQDNNKFVQIFVFDRQFIENGKPVISPVLIFHRTTNRNIIISINNIVKTDNFYAPIAKNKSGAYKIKSGHTIYLCFSTDFLVEDADEWRSE